MEVLVKESYIQILHDKSKQWLYVCWIGDQDVKSVKAGCQTMLEKVKQTQVGKILNDNTEVTSSWAGAAEWVGEVWFPEMLKAGVSCFCWIYSPFVFSRLSADTSISYVKEGPRIAKFDNLSEAEEWLLQCS